jgi:hypothetical protein
MALGERFRGTGSTSVAQFLADHQGCDAGIDVARDRNPGSGRLRISCKGCGVSASFQVAEAAEMASGPPLESVNLPPEASTAAVATPPPSPRPVARHRRLVPPAPLLARRRGLPPWLSNLLIVALILGGIGLIVAGILRSDGDSDSGGQVDQVQPVAPEQEGEAPTAVEPADEPASRPPALDRQTFIGRFAIGVPGGWRRASPGGNVFLTAPGGIAQIRVYSDSPARDPGELAVPTAEFLARENPGATVSKPRRVRFGGRFGIRLRATYGGGEEVATVVAADGFSFLVTYRQRDGADDRVVEQGDAAYASFRPR